jgi:3-hydroxyacyl-[acyl-carrier-protein] dehydratase
MGKSAPGDTYGLIILDKSLEICYMANPIDETTEVQHGGIITARVLIDAESAWFDGHFPDDPILPGVAQLNIVVELLQRALEKPVYANQLSRVRFKHLIRPGDCLDIRLSPKKDPCAMYWMDHRN